MRTTVNIDDRLLAEARARAAAGHGALGEVVDDALRVLPIERVELASTRRRVALPTAGGSGRRPGADLEDEDALAGPLGDNGCGMLLADANVYVLCAIDARAIGARSIGPGWRRASAVISPSASGSWS